MRRLRRAVADEHVSVGQFARAHALQEVLDVIEIQVARRLHHGGLRVAPDRVEFVARAIDPQAALGAAQLHGVPGDAGNQRGFERGRELRRVFQQHVDGVGRGAAVLVIVDAAQGRRRNRIVLPHEHVNHVDPVGEQVGHLPAAEIQVGAPIPVLLRVPVAPLQGAQEVRPIQVGGLRLERRRRLAQVVGIPVPPGARQRDLAQLARIHVEPFGLQVVLAGTLLHAHLADAVVEPRRLDDDGAFLDLQRQRFLHVHVFARVQSVRGHGRVPVVGNRNQHRVHVLQSQQRAVVGEGPGVGRGLFGAVRLRAVDVAQGHHIGVTRLNELPHIAAAAFAAADEAELHPVVSAENPGIGKRRGGGDATEKGPAGHVGIGHS